jgi:threonine aldolase
VALETMVDRLAEDHEKARVFAAALQQLAPGSVNPLPETNIIIVKPSALGRTPAALVAELGRHSIRTAGIGADSVRFVTHVDVTMSDIEYVIQVVADLVGAAEPLSR